MTLDLIGKNLVLVGPRLEIRGQTNRFQVQMYKYILYVYIYKQLYIYIGTCLCSTNPGGCFFNVLWR